MYSLPYHRHAPNDAVCFTHGITNAIAVSFANSFANA
jgi:hypothetical protein